MSRNWSDLSSQQQSRATALYQLLLSYFGNDAGVSAIMGNIWIESASTFDGRIVQGQGESTLDSYCQNYVDDVNDGTISENDFVYNGPGGGGFGLCQWTWNARKQGLYDFCFNGGYNDIGNTSMQAAWIDTEMRSGYQSTYSVVTSATESSLYNATVYVMANYEQPADQSQTAKNDRYSAAVAIYNALSGLPPIPPGPIPGLKDDILILKHFIDKNRKLGYII